MKAREVHKRTAWKERSNQRFHVKVYVGEADAELLFMTVINPKMRHLIRLRVKDAKKAADMFELLQSKTAQMREARRQLLKDNPLSYADIDN